MAPSAWMAAVRRGLSFRRIPSQQFVYGAFAGLCTLWVAADFFASIKDQLFLSAARAGVPQGEHVWSAPLDDVFIHFDFARSAARGYPFEWSEGNGYSSGGTSLLYPFVLSLGYVFGYTGLSQVLWSGIVACISVWALLLAAPRMMAHLPWWTKYLLPPLLLSIGGLNWSLFSGMEVAFFLAVWGLCLVCWDRLIHRRSFEHPPALALGLSCAVLVATRPESAPLVACFVLSAVALCWRRTNWVQRVTILTVGALPGAAVVVAQALANRLLTDDWSAAGALVKLELNHPHLSSTQVWDAWLFHLKYQVLRATDYHLSAWSWDAGGISLSAGWLLWLAAGAGLLWPQTRRYAVLLWLQSVLWVATVALNGQVRWQNERYTMPAVTWLLFAAILGWGQMLAYGVELWRRRQQAALHPARRVLPLFVSGVSLLSLSTFLVGQQPRYRDQLWFFGRAARNIYDQHVQTGDRLRHTAATRVMVGDAGAIPFISDLPAVDLIGLGGLTGYPFARATRTGLAAGLELLERMAPAERPNVMALYPSWWGNLPLWFGEPLFEVPVRGNVICGGRSKVVYRTNWDAFRGSAVPTAKPGGLEPTLSVDFADLLSERTAEVRFEGTSGYVGMKILPRTASSTHSVWDGGRILPPGTSTAFTLRNLRPNQTLHLTVRVAQAQPATLSLEVAGQRLKSVDLPAAAHWNEVQFEVPARSVTSSLPLVMRAEGMSITVYHLWGAQAP